MSDLMEIMRQIQTGERDVADVAEDFRTRTFPVAERQVDTDAEQAFRATEQDAPMDPDGSFAEVADAYMQGVITIDQYAILAEAASQSTATPTPVATGASEEPDEPNPGAPAAPEPDAGDEQ